MTYKLSPNFRLIKLPVILQINDEEKSYSDGETHTRLNFDQNLIVESITAREETIVITLKENAQMGVVNWIGEDSVSFI